MVLTPSLDNTEDVNSASTIVGSPEEYADITNKKTGSRWKKWSTYWLGEKF